MSDLGVYLCPACQEVIRAEGRKREELVCDSCGFALSDKSSAPTPTVIPENPLKAGGSGVVRNVVLEGGSLPTRAGAPAPPIRAKIPDVKKVESENKGSKQRPSNEEEVIREDGTRQIKRRKKRRKEKNKTLYLFLGSWILVVAVIVAFFHNAKPKDSAPTDVTDADHIAAERALKHDLFLQKHGSEVARVFKRFLAASVEGGKLQFIDQSSRLATKFGRFYEFESEVKVDPATLKMEEVRVVEFAEDKADPAIEIVWRSEEGERIESLCVWDGESWKVDWEHFVRYSSEPWALFKLQSGKSSGEFRVYARYKELGKNIEDSDSIKIALYGPSRPGVSLERIYDGDEPDVEFPTTSDLGQQYIQIRKEYLEREKNDDWKFGSKLGSRDPGRMIRLTVRLEWGKDAQKQPVVKLKEIIEPSWFGARVQGIYKEHLERQNEIDESSFLKKL